MKDSIYEQKGGCRSSSTHMSSPPRRTFLASHKRSKRTWTAEEEQPVCKSEKKTETLAIFHRISILVSFKDWEDDYRRKSYLFIDESADLKISLDIDRVWERVMEGFKMIIRNWHRLLLWRRRWKSNRGDLIEALERRRRTRSNSNSGNDKRPDMQISPNKMHNSINETEHLTRVGWRKSELMTWNPTWRAQERKKCTLYK